MAIGKARRVSQYTLKGKFIKSYRSMMGAGEQTGTNPGSIGKVCEGKRKTAGGYKWEYRIT